MYQSDGQCEPGKEVSEAMGERYTDISIKVGNKADLFVFMDMEYKITQNQKDKFIKLIQSHIDYELSVLKKFSSEGELSFGESMEVDSIDRIKVVDVEKKEGWAISVDIYKNTSRFSFDDVLYHIHQQLKKHIGTNSVNERNVIDIREFGPGVDF